MSELRGSNLIVFDGYKIQANEIGSSGACRIEIEIGGVTIDTNILLSALPSAREMETLLIRFDHPSYLSARIVEDIVDLIREMYIGPRLVLRVADNLTYQGRTAGGTLTRFQSDFNLLRIDNFVYIYNPWYEDTV